MSAEARSYVATSPLVLGVPAYAAPSPTPGFKNLWLPISLKERKTLKQTEIDTD